MNAKQPTAGIVLAAGMAKRFDGTKLLARLADGQTVLARTLNACLASRLAHVFLVLGHQQDQILASLDRMLRHPKLSVVPNPDYQDGQSTSLRAGIARARKAFPSAMLVLGDQPLITSEFLDDLLARYRAASQAICVPFHEQQRGNPVIVGRSFYDEIEALTGDIGARKIIANHPEQVLRVPVAAPGVFQDVDTREDVAVVDAAIKG